MIRQGNPSIKSFGRSWRVLAGIAWQMQLTYLTFPWDHLLVSSLWDALIWQWWIWKRKVKTSPARSRLSCRFIQTVQADRWARDFLLHFIGTLHIHRINFHKLRRFNFVLQRLQSPRTLSASWSMRSTLASYNQTVICTAQPDQQIQYVSIVNSIGSWYLSGDVNIREVFVLWPTALIYPPVMAGTATYLGAAYCTPHIVHQQTGAQAWMG